MFDRIMLSFLCATTAYVAGTTQALAQTTDKPAAAPQAVKPSVLRIRARQAESPDKSGMDRNSGAKGGSSPMDAMNSTAAPKSGAMPLGTSPASTGKIGTESTAKGKLGTPPDPNNKDRPPRPN